MSSLTSIPGGLYTPLTPPCFNTVGFNVQGLSGSGDRIAVVLSIPKTGTLDSFEFMTGAVTTFPTNGIRLSFQTLSTTGSGSGFSQPSGTQAQFCDITSNPGATTWAAPPHALTNDGTSGGTKRSVTIGDLVACVIEQVNTGDTWNMEFRLIDLLSSSAILNAYPATIVRQTNAYATISKMMTFALKYSDGSYVNLGNPMWWPVKAWNLPTVASNTDPKEFGLYFQLPVPVKVSGCWFVADLDGDVDVLLYDSNGTSTLADTFLDTNYRARNGASLYSVYFQSSEVSLLAATNYRLTLAPSTTTSVGLQNIDVNAAALMDCLEGGQNFQWTQKSSGGVWSQTTTKRPFMGLIVSQIHDGVGGAFVPTVLE